MGIDGMSSLISTRVFLTAPVEVPARPFVRFRTEMTPGGSYPLTQWNVEIGIDIYDADPDVIDQVVHKILQEYASTSPLQAELTTADVLVKHFEVTGVGADVATEAFESDTYMIMIRTITCTAVLVQVA